MPHALKGPEMLSPHRLDLFWSLTEGVMTDEPHSGQWLPTAGARL